MDHPSLWKLMIEAWSALSEHYEPVVEQHCMEHRIDLKSWALLLAVLSFEPEATTPGHLLVRVPYTAAEVYQERLENMRTRGNLDLEPHGGYKLTQRGRELTTHLIAIAREEMSRVDPLKPDESKRLAQIVGQLVKCSYNHTPPPDTWSIRLSSKLMPPLDPPLPCIEQGFSALAAYRDDAHLAAWNNSGLSATALETLTLLWRGEVASHDDLCRKLVNRGHGCHVHLDAIQDLRQSGYVSGPDYDLHVTPTGRLFRNRVEDLTDHYFFAPWNCLEGGERDEFESLLELLKKGLLVAA